MKTTAIALLTTVISLTVSTMFVSILALMYVWSEHDGRRRRAREMVVLLLRRDRYSFARNRRHVPLCRPENSRRGENRHTASGSTRGRGRTLEGDRRRARFDRQRKRRRIS